MTIKAPSFQVEADEVILLCPNCSFNHTHHDKVEIFEREDDAAIGNHCIVTREKIVCDGDIKDNPSDRRHGLSIFLYCENCSDRFELCIAQHKGQTKLFVKK